jgi:DNA-binding transcriptional LysR family regulator
MARRNLNDLLAFVTVAREGSFTRAAAVLGVTQSALSQAISGLEERLEIRLLARTTRSVSPTAAGERLLNAIGHRFDEIEAELDALTECGTSRPARCASPAATHVSADHAAAQVDAAAARLPRHQDRVRHQLRIPGHRGRPLRRRRADGQTPSTRT